MTEDKKISEFDGSYNKESNDSTFINANKDTMGQESKAVEDLNGNQPMACLKNYGENRLEGHSVLGIDFAPINLPWERRLQTLSVLLCFTFLLIVGWVLILVLVYMALYTKYWWFSLGYLAYYIKDKSICERGGRRSNKFRSLKFWNSFADYYPLKLIKTTELDPNRNYIMCYHPHGVTGAGAIGSFAMEGTGFSEKFPGITPYILTLPINFYFPFTRELVLAAGIISCSKRSMSYILSHAPGSGHALVLAPGGAKESLVAKPGDATIYLKSKMGFIKIALQHGASLVPMYSFGENEIYEQFDNPEGSLMYKFQSTMQQLLTYSPVFFKGRGIFQYSFGLLPFRRPMFTVVGSPIDVVKVTEPTSEQIINLHSKYTEAVIELYNKHKHKYALDPSVDLKII